MADLTIENIKSIRVLEFNIPRNGVNIITGTNGVGKTTLMACLERLANKNAFQKHFRTSSNDAFDSFTSGRITYHHNGRSVSYAYSNVRWQPNPRRNSKLLQNFGFRQVLFIPSNGERFYVQDQELQTRLIQAAPAFFRESLNAIFQTNKFSELRRIKLIGRGRGESRRNYAFLMPINPTLRTLSYFSEKNFSLGEILVLNALYEISNVRNGSLVLIDEVELALHPKVQINFLTFLKRIAAEKNLSIILSTHSTSLIKNAPRLIHLGKDAITGGVVIDYDCYPALALRDIAFEEDVQPDVILFVEDENAKFYLEALVEYYFRQLRQNSKKPILKILPVGGWKETMRFLVNSDRTLVPKHVSAFAVLDNDVEPVIVNIQANPNRTMSEQELLNIYNSNRGKIKFLNITPELGIIDSLNHDPHNQIQLFQNFFETAIDLAHLIQSENNRGLNYPANPRAAAKARLDFYVQEIAADKGWDSKRVRSQLYQYYLTSYGPGNTNEIQSFLGPIF